jgi:predicted aspartyl protease
MRIYATLFVALLSAPTLAETVAPMPPASAAADTITTGLDLAQRLTVPVMVNGQGPFNFVIDTGADRTVISEELAERMGLPEAGKATLHAMGGSAKVSIVKIESVAFSNVNSRNVRAAALPYRNVGADGLLGIDSLKGQRIVMDFTAGTMRIEPSAAPEEKISNGEQIIVTARSKLGQLVMVDADAAGQPISVVVDTGAQNTVGNERLRGLLERRVRGTEIRKVDMIDVLGQRTPADYTVVDRIRIGGVAMGNLSVSFANAHPFKIFGLSRKPSMLLGIETLKAFRRVSVDFTTRKIKFLLPDTSRLPNPGSDIASDAVGGGIQGVAGR